MPEAVEKLKSELAKAKEILILIRDNPKLDHVASALSLYLGLKDQGYSVTVACPTPMRVEFNRLVGVNRIAATIGNRNLVISFPYVKDSIEKVSYHVDEQSFNLVIQPKPGFPSLDSSKVRYAYSGAEAQVVFVVGAQQLEDLGVLYQAERSLFETATIVNIDAHPRNSRFAQLNLVWNGYSSCAEVVTETFERLGLKLNEDSASNLLAGLSDATQNFQGFGVKPSAFEMAAKLMQAGGKRMPASLGRFSPFGSAPASTSVGLGGPTSPFSSGFDFGETPFPTTPVVPQPQVPGTMPLPRPSPQPQNTQPRPMTTPPAVSQAPKPSQAWPKRQPLGGDDWLKPKIYKGSTKV